MTTKGRYLVNAILEDLRDKMVFLGGPRQVGKTTLAVDLIGNRFPTSYFNWDKLTQRKQALKGMWPPDSKLIILDEFHKSTKWKSWIKGEFDTHKEKHKFLLTGSARLDIYRRGGDSLQGRYHYYRLHPFSLAELREKETTPKAMGSLGFADSYSISDYELLLKFGGFPEPLIKQNDRTLRRWHNERIERFICEDIRDLTMIQDIGNLTLLLELLPERVSSILSINSLAGDLQVNFRTVSNWLDVFDRLYYTFRISPYQSRKIASARKEKKLYLWDWSSILNESARLENMVASHLLKFCHYLNDHDGWNTELYYLRDTTGREVDFLVTIDRKPWFAVEVKTGDEQLSKNLLYFRDRLRIPYSYQLMGKGSVEFERAGVHVLPTAKFVNTLI